MTTAVELIKQEEGFREKPYQDSFGIWTIGHGITNITEEESTIIVELRVKKLNQQLEQTFAWYENLSNNRKAILISMAYQLGIAGIKKFKKMLNYIEEEDFEKASKEGLDSRWARQTPNRAKRQMEALRTNVVV